VTANHIADRCNLKKLASRVDAILTDMTEKVAEKISSLNNEIKRIDCLSPTSEAVERENALSATQTKLDATEQQLRQVKKDAGWGGLLAPFQTLSRYKDVRRAKAEHARATEKFESQEERETRTSRVSEHNQNVVRERERLPELEQDLGESERESTDLINFRQQVAEAITAARADGWIAPNFPEKFQAMAQHLEADKLAEATGCLSELKFQCTPSTQTYESWCQEATQILEKAYEDYRGFTPAGAYTEIAGRSIALAHPTARPFA
jgi:hypothetical protein